MSWRLVVAGGALPLLLGGCVVTRAGTLTGIPGGPAIAVTVAVREESATVRGVNPQTGEALTGVLQVEHAERPPGGLAPAPGVGPHVGLAPSPAGPVVMVFVGRLEGDRGTGLKCTLEVERRLRLRGRGVCRLADSEDQFPIYRLSFD